MFGFAKAARKSAAYTRTENGAVALNTTRDARLDLFGVIGALRGEKKARIERLFSEAYRMDTLFATKIALYARDVRGGLGERETFRTIMRYMALMHPEALRPNLDLIGVYGRYDDLYCLIGTPLENEMWAAMKAQFEEDRRNLEAGGFSSGQVDQDGGRFFRKNQRTRRPDSPQSWLLSLRVQAHCACPPPQDRRHRDTDVRGTLGGDPVSGGSFPRHDDLPQCLPQA